MRAVKFKDLDAFFVEMEKQSFGEQALELIYDQDRLPYGSAYLVPVDLLPSGFDQNRISQFGGQITQVEAINYTGTETFYQDFMIFPKSLEGYLEIESDSDTTFAASKLDESEWRDMSYVINLEDGGGKEFFLSESGEMVSLESSDQQPQEFKNLKLLAKHQAQLREKYTDACTLYPVIKKEFDVRRKQLQKPPNPQT